MVPEHQRLSPDDRSKLVAYLDGELNDAEARGIATKLTQSMTARREVELLRKTWDMLDLLPRPRASEDFTARTLIVAEQGVGRGDRVASAASEWTRKIGIGVAWLGASLLLSGLGYLLVLRAWPNPTARLARDLTIAESLDEYRAAGDMDYLELLDMSPDFN